MVSFFDCNVKLAEAFARVLYFRHYLTGRIIPKTNMDQRSEQPSKYSVPIAIIIGSFVIAGAIMLSGGKYSTAPTAAPNNAVQQRVQPPVDSSKVNAQGEPFIGEKSAPVIIAYWYDYQCPFCKQNEETSMTELLKDYVDTGKARIIFKDFQFLGPDSQTLGKVSRAVWEAAPDKFYAWHKAIFDNQGQEGSGWATQAKIQSITVSVLGQADAAKALALADQNAATYQKEMDADKTEAASFGVNGTPAMVIGELLVTGAAPYAEIKSDIETTLAGK
jgi:protein-disulfide isomerase